MSGPNFCEPCGFYHPRDFDCVSSRERDQSTQRLLAAEKAAYDRGRADGYKEGYEFGARLADAQWRRIAPAPNEPTHAELEARRWGPGGREHFGDPRPGDRRPARETAA